MALMVALDTLFFIILGALWKHDTDVNTAIKVFMWLMASTHAFQMLLMSGYIVHVRP